MPIPWVSPYTRAIIVMFLQRELASLIDYLEEGDPIPFVQVERAELSPEAKAWLPDPNIGEWEAFRFFAEKLDDRIGTLYVNEETGVFIYAPVTG